MLCKKYLENDPNLFIYDTALPLGSHPSGLATYSLPNTFCSPEGALHLYFLVMQKGKVETAHVLPGIETLVQFVEKTGIQASEIHIKLKAGKVSAFGKAKGKRIGASGADLTQALAGLNEHYRKSM